MFFVRNITTLLSVLLVVMLFSACRKLDKEGPATATVSIVLSHSQSASRMARVSTSFTAGVDTELIALVTDNTTFNQKYLSLENRYQFALTDLSTDTVTLTVPLDTGIKLYSYAYFGDDFTLSELENTVTQADEFGETSSFTISTDDTSKEVSLKYFYRQMGGSIQGTELSLSTVVTTLAGDNDTNNVSTDETGVDASFSQIYTGITTDGTNLYVAEYGSNKIRKIVIDNGTVTTLAGTGTSVSTDGTGTAASFARPMGITTDGTNLYIVDYNGHKIRKLVISTGVVTTLAGSSNGFADHDNGTLAKFYNPRGITTDGTNLYVGDTSNRRIRQIVIDNGTVTTLAGSGSSSSTNGKGTAASFSSPEGITNDGNNLYVVDRTRSLIRKIE